MADRPHLARPCTARGVTLTPREDGTYFCPECRDVVHDLRAKPRSEASRLFRENGSKLCGIVNAWSDGELRFASEPPTRGLAAAAGSVALALAMSGCGGEEAAPEPAPLVEPEAPEPTPDPVQTPVVETVEETPAGDDETEVAANTDDSPHRHHHEEHAHTHEPVNVDDLPLAGGLEGL